MRAMAQRFGFMFWGVGLSSLRHRGTCSTLNPERSTLNLLLLFVFTLVKGPRMFRGGLVLEAHRLVYRSTLKGRGRGQVLAEGLPAFQPRPRGTAGPTPLSRSLSLSHKLALPLSPVPCWSR